MKHVNLFFVLIFSFHFNVQASQIHLPLSPDMISTVLDSFNGLSQEERKEYVNSILKKNDEAFFTKNQNALEGINWPDLSIEKNEITFRYQNQNIGIKVEDDGVVSLKGKRVPLRKGKFAIALNSITDILETPTTSWTSVFLSEAHALFPAIVLALLALAVAALVLYPAVSVVKNGILKLKCFEIRSEMGDLTPGTMTSTQASDIKSKVRRLMGDIDEDLRTTDCRVNASVCRDLQQNKSCYRQVENEINEVYPDQINTSGRGESFIERWTPSFMRSRGSRVRGQ